MWIEKWVWNNGGMIVTGNSESDKKTCPSATQIISKPEIQRQVQGTASLTKLVSCKFITANNTKLTSYHLLDYTDTS
jgi:hypothetical protein